MRKIIVLLFVLGLAFVFNFRTFAQDNATRKQEQEKMQRLKEEAKHLSPVRYVIVYNDVSDSSLSGRYIDIIIDEKQFNEENLIKVFDLVKKRFPSPFPLSIDIHTNLATIETPEEREKAHDSMGRLTNKIFVNKTAGYSRFSGGREAFIYATNLSPYERKIVVLVDKP